MSNPTSNFGWQMPTPTDLVTSLPADFEVFGQAVDSSMADLKGGTSGQILSKNSNTDMDFVWITNDQGDITAVTAGTGITGGGTSGAVTITNSMATAIDAKGDLIAGTGADAFSRIAAGNNGETLIADSSASTGLKWAKSPNFVGCSVYASAGQTITSNTWTAINFGFEDFDTNTFHDNSTNNSRLTIPTGLGGKYLITYTQRWDPSGAGGRIANIYVNGTSYTTQAMNASSTYASNTKSVIFELAAGQYIQLYAYQDSGSNLVFYGRNEEQPFQIQYLGA